MAYPTSVLPQDRNVFFDPHDVGALVEPLRSRIYTVIQDAPNHGLTLVSGRRSPWQQYLLRVGRVGAAHAFNSRYPGNPRTALPYQSHHQTGQAADMGGRDLGWLDRVHNAYGLARTVSSENWHFEAVGNPSVRIIPYPGSTPSQPASEEFTVDAEAKKYFDSVNLRLDAIGERLDTFEKDRLKPTTSRVRAILEHLKIKDPA